MRAFVTDGSAGGGFGAPSVLMRGASDGGTDAGWMGRGTGWGSIHLNGQSEDGSDLVFSLVVCFKTFAEG